MVHLNKAECVCKLKTADGFLAELIDCEIFPFRSIFRKGHSIIEILGQFGSFEFEASPGACSDCKEPVIREKDNGKEQIVRAPSYEALIEDTQRRVRNYFDGWDSDDEALCRGRSRRSSRKEFEGFSQQNVDYMQRRFDVRRRFQHERPRWYFLPPFQERSTYDTRRVEAIIAGPKLGSHL